MRPCCADLARRLVCKTTITVAALGMCLLWAYWPTLGRMADRWSSDPQYSHGFLVPVFALIILWYRREHFPAGALRPSWWGLAWLAIGALLRLTGAYFYLEALDGLSLLPVLAGLCVLLWGESVLRWCWPALAFLGFMLPLPHQVEVALAQPLRHLATAAATLVLQLLGYPAIAEGNIILIDDVRLGVIDACSGLGMLVTFFALATAMALIVQRPLFDRLVLVVSAIPIALVANIVRITATGVAHRALGVDAGRAVMHELAGWLMMPLALGLLYLELLYLKHLLVEEEPHGPLPLVLTDIAAPASAPSQADRVGKSSPALGAATPSPHVPSPVRVPTLAPSGRR